MTKKIVPRRGGRPTEANAEKIHARILDVASVLFLSDGYGSTSIEAIAKQTGISKRTLYARFADKAALFTAVVERLIRRMRPADVAPLFTGNTLEEILRRLAEFILTAALSPEALALHRLTVSEARRFPEIAAIMDSEGSRREAIERISSLLDHHAPKDHKNLDAKFAAEQFLQMVIAAPQQRALERGMPMHADEMDAWVHQTVQLFLRGIHQ